MNLVLSTELLAHYRALARQVLTVVDVETTGRWPNSSRMIELSVLQATLADGVQHQQADLVNPSVSIPAYITQFTGISSAMIAPAEKPEVIYLRYWAWLNQGVLTAHNLDFDYSFLQAEYRRLGHTFIRPEPQRLCTVQLSRLMLADLPSRSLPDLVQHFGFEVGPSHRAEADTQACWLLAQRLLTELLTESDEVLLRRFAQQWLPLKLVAKLMGCSQQEGRSRLEQAGVFPRSSRRSGRLMYRRGDVERQLPQQLSLLQPDSLERLN